MITMLGTRKRKTPSGMFGRLAADHGQLDGLGGAVEQVLDRFGADRQLIVDHHRQRLVGVERREGRDQRGEPDVGDEDSVDRAEDARRPAPSAGSPTTAASPTGRRRTRRPFPRATPLAPTDRSMPPRPDRITSSSAKPSNAKRNRVDQRSGEIVGVVVGGQVVVGAHHHEHHDDDHDQHRQQHDPLREQRSDHLRQ